MSLDARYILSYEALPYSEPTPMQKDVEYLKDKYGGEFDFLEECTIFWDKPKYTLLDEELHKLHADRILERKDCELWEVVK